MSLLTTIGHGVGSMCRWLFVTKCTTAAPLLSLSFAINSIYTGISLSRLNLSEWMCGKIVECIDGVADDKFLRKVEQAGKENKDLGQKLKEFSDKVERFTTAIRDVSSILEETCRIITICCAAAAFFLMAFEVKTRIGFVLVFQYLVILFGHAIWMLALTYKVKSGYKDLGKAMEAIKNGQAEFDVNACINNLKKQREDLLKHNKSKKGSRH